jgi:hypothetical protein
MSDRPRATILHHDPLPALLASQNPAVAFWAARGGKVPGAPATAAAATAQTLWNLPEAQCIIGRQQPDGSWKYPGGNRRVRSAENYNQIETYRQLGYLVEMYGFDRSNPAIARAAEFMLHFQTPAGDIRGILGQQYTPYYTGGILELLIKAGYGDDSRVDRAFAWLASMRQNDGGWAIPLRTRGRKLDVISMDEPALEPDRARPSSHLVTGMVLRAYAAHPRYRHAPEVRPAAKLLLSRLFRPDTYPDRRTAGYWLRFTFPFWFTDLISALDTLTLLGFSATDPQIARGVRWLADQQQPNGLWQLKTLKNPQLNPSLWLSLAIARIMRRLEG